MLSYEPNPPVVALGVLSRPSQLDNAIYPTRCSWRVKHISDCLEWNIEVRRVVEGLYTNTRLIYKTIVAELDAFVKRKLRES